MINNLEQLRNAITTLVEYNWAAEEKDFAENPDEGHVFNTLKDLDEWANVEQ